MKTAHDYFAPGDIVFNHWWYEQTNIDFYMVDKVTDKFLTLKAIGQSTIATHEDWGSEVMPEPSTILYHDHDTEQNGRHWVRIYDDDALVNFRHGGWYKWNGKPKHVSSPR